MAIRRWDPVGDLVLLKERVNRLLDETLSRSRSDGVEAEGGGSFRPALDVFEESGRYVLRADLPGVGADDVEVRVDDGTLILRGERRRDPGIPSESYLRVERPYGPFRAEVALPPSVEPEGIQALHRAGVLEIVLPKRRRDTGPGRIPIEQG